MDNLIELLKDNEKPFGLMSEEMQEKARKIGILGNFRQFVGPGWGGIYKATGCNFHDIKTYRLRPDYTEEPAIVECEISKTDDGSLGYRRKCNGGCGGSNLLFRVLADPDFIGFKFEDGIVTGLLIRYKMPHRMFSTFAYKNFAEIEVLHATHVLFRRKDKE